MNQEQIDNLHKQLVYDLNIALYQESVIREAAFLNFTYNVAGIELDPLTLRKYIMLDFVRSPFVTDGMELTTDRIWECLWILSREFQMGKTNVEFIENNLKRIGNEIDYNKITEEIVQYLSECLLDTPTVAQSSMPNTQGTPTVSWVSGYITLIASEFGWSDEYILDLPVARVFQFVRNIEIRLAGKNGESYKPYNRLSDPCFKILAKFTDDKAAGRLEKIEEWKVE